MKTLNLLTATLDDIVFEGRNQAYGAYLLRRLYHQHLATAVATSLALCLLLLSIPALVQRFSPTAPTINFPADPGIIDFTDVTILPPTPPKPLAQPVAPPAARAVVVKANPAEVMARVVPDELATEPLPTKPLTGDVTTPGADIGTVAIEGTSTGVRTTTPGTDSGTTVEAPNANAVPFVHAEVMPTFVGGPEALQRYMQRNLRFPSRAAGAAVSGRVFIAFTVNVDGSISDVTVLKGLGYGTDEEAVRVVSKMPAWTPGRQNSHPVAVRYTMPITFQYQ